MKNKGYAIFFWRGEGGVGGGRGWGANKVHYGRFSSSVFCGFNLVKEKQLKFVKLSDQVSDR